MSREGFDITKMRSVVLYILDLQPGTSIEKLHLLLFLCDLEHYGRFGRPLMGGTYVKREWGPECRELDAVLRDMERAGEIECVESPNEDHSAV
jgi:hypothetical protein